MVFSPESSLKSFSNFKVLEFQENNVNKFKILSRKNIQCNLFWENCNGKSAPNRLIYVFRSFSKFKQATCVREKYVVRTSIRTNNERKKTRQVYVKLWKISLNNNEKVNVKGTHFTYIINNQKNCW
jgi:hypothetical protein